MKVIRTTILFSFCLLVSNPPANGQPKQKTPLEGLQSIPFPPTTIQEALRRCPNDRDTLVQSFSKSFDNIHETGEIGKNESAVFRHLTVYVDSFAYRLLDEVRLIGEDLDSKIKKCRAGNSGYDTLCVGSAEAEALNKRQQASAAFLRDANSSWYRSLDSIKTITRQRLATPMSVTESRKQNSMLWNVIRPLLETEEQITRLAVQFFR